MKMDCVIYTKENCTWCVAAKEFLKNQRTSYEEIKIGEDITRDELLEKYPEAKTVPIIVIDNEWIGGYMELVEYFTSNGMMLA
jgi:glutaredoxin 3